MANRPLGVLVADDEPFLRALLDKALAREGFWCRVAAGGEEAVELLRAHGGAIDVVLLDVCMQGQSGPATLARLRELAPGLPCVFISGRAEDAEAEVRGLGCRVLAKPFTVPQVVAALREAAGAGGREWVTWLGRGHNSGSGIQRPRLLEPPHVPPQERPAPAAQ